MMEYHVLSNFDITRIVMYGLVSLAALGPLFSYFASRDSFPNDNKEKSWFRKIIPWVVLLVFISDVALLASKLLAYPWDMEPVPSQASAFREVQYLPTGIILYGWANDYQLPLLSPLTGAILWFCWTVYAFRFKPSATSWWKKTCKVIAYIIISITIFGFQLHQFGDLWGYAMILVAVIVLFWIAHVKPEKQNANVPVEMTNESQEQVIENVAEESGSTQNENPLRFMPKVTVDKEIIETASIEVPKPIKQDEEVHEVTTTPPEPIIEEVVVPVTAPVNEHLPQNEVNQFEESDMMYCKHCGKRIESDSTFCKYCGKRL